MEYIVPVDVHDQIIKANYRLRGYDKEEANQATANCRLAAWHGIRTHNGIKGLELEKRFGSGCASDPLCVAGARIDKQTGRFPAIQTWNANRKLGQPVAVDAMATCMKLADQYGVGIVTVDSAFHYLWGGGYVLEAAKRGYFAYTSCTSSLAEVVPFMGTHPTLGTNPHSWAFPTTDSVGFPILIDWATSIIAMGRVHQHLREGKTLPVGAAVDKEGKPTVDPNEVTALLPFGGHKGYGLALIDELIAAMVGGSLPTIRSRPQPGNGVSDGEKYTVSLFFQAIVPEALTMGNFACGRDQAGNIKAIIDDVLGHGNASCMLPGQVEAEAARRSEAAGGLRFTSAEVEELKGLADQVDIEFDPSVLKEAS